MMKKLLILVTILFTLYSCKKTNYLDEISNRFKEDLLDWNFTLKNVKNNTDTIIFLFDVDKEKNNVFFDEKTNHIIVNALIESEYIYLTKIIKDKIIFQFNFVGIDGNFKFIIKKNDLKDCHNFFNEYNYDLVINTIKNIKYNGLIEFDGLLKALNKDSYYIKHEGDFWDLLKDYSKNCVSAGKDIKSLLIMSTLVSIITDSENDYKYLFKDNDMYYFLDHCGYDRKLSKMKLFDLVKYLDNIYKANTVEKEKALLNRVTDY